MTDFEPLPFDLEPPDEPAEIVYVPPPPAWYCACRPDAEVREGWQHAPECLRWSPPLVGHGSRAEHRAAAMAHIRAVIADARRRHQEGPASPGAGAQEALKPPPGHTDTPDAPTGAQGATA
ncbi:MAG: hypothetical protein ACJ768_25545 [Gaiellaceae bacterium]